MDVGLANRQSPRWPHAQVSAGQKVWEGDLFAGWELR